MMRTIVIALAACAAALTGCKSIEVDRKGQSLATVKHADGTVEVVKDTAGRPLVLDGGWRVDYFQHWNWQSFDNLEAKAGEAELRINNYQSGSDTNLTALVDASMAGATRLVVSIGETYAKVAGGGAQADTVLDVAQRVYAAFTAAGGDPARAAVAEADGRLRVSDGNTCVSCDRDGNCSGGACAPSP